MFLGDKMKTPKTKNTKKLILEGILALAFLAGSTALGTAVLSKFPDVYSKLNNYHTSNILDVNSIADIYNSLPC